MQLKELAQACDEAERQMSPAHAHIIVTAAQRERFARSYRVCKGLSGNVIGITRDGRLTIAIKCSKVRAFLKQFNKQE